MPREWKVPDVLGAQPRAFHQSILSRGAKTPASAAGPASAVSGRPRIGSKKRIFVIAITSQVQSAALFSYTSIVNVTFDGSS